MEEKFRINSSTTAYIESLEKERKSCTLYISSGCEEGHAYVRAKKKENGVIIVKYCEDDNTLMYGRLDVYSEKVLDKILEQILDPSV